MPHKIFATSKAILETSSELSIEVDRAMVRLVSLEEGPGSSMKNKLLLSVNQTIVTKGRGVCMVFKLVFAHASSSTLSRYVTSRDSPQSTKIIEVA